MRDGTVEERTGVVRTKKKAKPIKENKNGSSKESSNSQAAIQA